MLQILLKLSDSLLFTPSFSLVNGGYTPWTKFGKCSKECDVGQMRRSRECNNPEPKFGGLDCRHLGPKADRFPCFNVPCSNCKCDRCLQLKTSLCS